MWDSEPMEWDDQYRSMEDLHAALVSGKHVGRALTYPKFNDADVDVRSAQAVVEMTPRALEVTALVQNVDHLDMRERRVPNGFWKAARSLPLDFVRFFRCEMEDFDKNDLPPWKLRTLVITSGQWSNDQVRAVLAGYAPHIEVILFRNAQLTTESFPRDVAFAALREVDVYGSGFDDRLFQILSPIKTLTRVRFTGDGVITRRALDTFQKERPDVEVFPDTLHEY
jgi:hypothetical protein